MCDAKRVRVHECMLVTSLLPSSYTQVAIVRLKVLKVGHAAVEQREVARM
jgi:hypothetical protein